MLKMNLFIGVLVFIYGLVLGSFFNCVGLRWVLDKSIAGRSKCPKCDVTLGALNLIPVFSFLFQGGKCHNCKTKISWIYPLVELATAVSYLFVYLTYGLSVDFVIGIIFMSFLLTSAVTDYKEGYVLDKVVIPPTIIILLLTIFFKEYGLLMNVVPAIVVFFLLLIPVKMGKLGSGDVGIIADSFLVHSMLFGSISMLLSSTVTLIYMLIFKKDRIPFIPFLAIGNLLTYIAIYLFSNYNFGMFLS
jgi:leader peptidase (prepilin peptidase)/N-methyltransferase